MQIFVKTLTGLTITLDVDAAEPIYNILDAIRDKEGVPPEPQALMYVSRMLEASRTLADYNILKEATLHLVLQMSGGGSPEESPQ
jgi:hypothetical protein